MKKAFTKKVFQIIILKFVIHAWGSINAISAYAIRPC